MGRDRAVSHFFRCAIFLLGLQGQRRTAPARERWRDPDHKSPSCERRIMAAHKGKSAHKQHSSLLRFPQVRGKIVDGVEVDAETITILFRDKTALSFDFDPTLIIYPELADFRTGNWRGIKRWRSIHSKPTMVRWP